MNENQIKTIVREVVKELAGGEREEANKGLHARIMELDPDTSRIRKTVFLSEDIAEQLDGFAKRTRVNNSDIVELALIDILERYQNQF
jgi:hypothetical protein